MSKPCDNKTGSGAITEQLEPWLGARTSSWEKAPLVALFFVQGVVAKADFNM